MARKPGQSISDLRRELFFEPCTSRDELKVWLLTFLGVDLPDFTVDEESTSNPMQFVWECYDFMRTNQGAAEHVLAAGRGTAKTLCAAVVEFLGMVHFRRQHVHMSALRQQSKIALKFLHKFGKIPELQGHFDSKSTFEISLSGLPPSFTTKSDSFIAVVAATIDATNGYRSNCIVGDEIDLTSRDVISEASLMGIPTYDEHAFDPLTIYLSSRKTNDGPLQDRMDKAEEFPDDIRVHKISWVDWMERCLPQRHGEAGVKAFISRENLQVHWDELPLTIMGADRTQYTEIDAYEGCRKCPAFVACQGRAPRQESTSKFLKSIQFVGRELKKMSDPNKIIGQVINWRPESSGVVFNTFSRPRHVCTLVEAWKWITSRDWTLDQPPTKEQLHAAATMDGWKCLAGIDYGTRDPAVILTALYHPVANQLLFLNMHMMTGFSNELWSRFYVENESPRFPADWVSPDIAPSVKAVSSYFAGSGVNLHLPSSKSKIEVGVSQLSGLLFNPISQSVNLRILDTPDLAFLCESFNKWRYKSDATGRFIVNSFDTDGEYTHPLDAARYLLNPYVRNKGRVSTGYSTPVDSPQPAPQPGRVLVPDNAIQQHLINVEGVDPNAFNQQAMYDRLKAKGLEHLVENFATVKEEKAKSRVKVYF